VRVARCAGLLAAEHGVDANKARLAGMLHDLARLYSNARLIDECEMRRMPIGDFERKNPVVLHAPLGARLAQEAFGVIDPQVLSAIEKHTVAAAEMSPLDCVVYLADGLEPGRDFDARAALWALARRDLAAAMRETLKNSLDYLERKGFAVAPQTLAAARTFGLMDQDTEGVLPSLN
jgi:predicted HD superfamily hydrolase involved in NAD metabolism